MIACIVGAIAAVTFGVVKTDQGRVLMDWWILELITLAVLVVIAFWLGPLIKRFGRSYAADVFRANPRTGKSFLMLTDVAYYLIFFAYILFTVSFEPKGPGTTRSTPPSSSTRRRASAGSCSSSGCCTASTCWRCR